MTMLLDGEQGEVCYSDICEKGKSREEGKPFALPEKNTEMRRAFAYLTTTRGISRTVLAEFIKRSRSMRTGNIIMQCLLDMIRAVWHVMPDMGHLQGKALKGNEESSDPKYSFHWTGKSGRIYVFEAPIDLLSFLTLYQKEWEQHSYVALCGLSEQGLFQMLEDVPYIRQVALCLDRDRAGLQAEERIQKNLEGRGYREVFPLFPSGKDWNEDLQELMAKGRRENLQMQ